MPKTKKKSFQMTPLSLQTICILHLPEDDSQVLQHYSQEFLEELRQRFWKETTRHPDPLPYQVSTLWLANKK